MTREPTLSIMLPTFANEDRGNWADTLALGSLLDSCGVDRLVVPDHVVFGEELEDYGRPELGGVSGGVQPTGPDGHWLEPLTTLAVLAGRTRRIRLGTNILLAALRRPVVLAKTAATLDVLSGGRLDLGVGVGWQRAEYAAAGLEFNRRGELLDETLQICRSLWTAPAASYDTAGRSVGGIHMMPKPLQAGGVPLWISGTVNPRVVRRIKQHGTGWIPWGPAAADLGQGIKAMREALAVAEYDATELAITGTVPVITDDRRRVDCYRTLQRVPELLDIGVTNISLGLRIPREPAEAEELISSLVGEFRRLTRHQ